MYHVQLGTKLTFKKTLDYFYCDDPFQCLNSEWQVLHDKCTKYICYAFCETDAHRKNESNDLVQPVTQIVLPNTTSFESSLVPFPHVTCDQGHVTHAFLAFDRQIHCFHKTISDQRFCNSIRGWNLSKCDGHVTSFPIPFTCRNEAQYVHYTLVCDHRQDCQDNSDEDFCFFSSCDPSIHFECETRQECQPRHVKCNYQPNCLDASDEDDCPTDQYELLRELETPFIVNLEGMHGYPNITNLKNTTYSYCPHTHYLCPDGNCMPVFTRCNGVADCMGKEDERECESYVCPGLYRCRGHELCVLPSDLCDGVLHCPQHDDGRFCNLPCPDHCTCLGYAFVCRRSFDGQSVTQLRYLDARGSGMKLEELTQNDMLIYLNLVRCNIVQVNNVTLPNLNILDLSDNKITTIYFEDIFRLESLHDLKLSGNPISSLFAVQQTDVWQLSALQLLDVSRVKLDTLNLTSFVPFSSLQVLNLSQSGVEIVQKTDKPTSLPRTLRKLDVRGCTIKEFPRTLFQGVENLKVVYADTYKLCCPAILPAGFIIDDCHAPPDDFSSCDDLLRTSFYRGWLFVLATFGVLGNSVSFIVRLCAKKRNSRSGFRVFVQNLCLSDFLMGIYLLIIASANSFFTGNYVWEDTSWRHSTLCMLAGFIYLMSSEVSSFVICLITLDRFLVLRFPFSQLHFRPMSAQIASATAWVVGGTLAGVPLLPVAKTWRFYTQTAICTPFPVTGQDFAAPGYVFGVMITLNVLFIIWIAGGQVTIYASIQSVKMSDGETSSKSHDAAIARRLITIAAADFLCWFPSALMGLLGANGIPVPNTAYVVMKVVVSPLNSVLNPFLYTLNILQECFQKRKEDRMLEILMQQI